MAKPLVCIVSPALATANNGNWHTAARWQEFLSEVAEVKIVQSWAGQPADALIALHARRSATSIAAFRHSPPSRPLALVLTGTDLYRDIAVDSSALHSLECATHLVVLQHEALHSLPPATRAKARVIVQSASLVKHASTHDTDVDFLAVGHLREEKDPLTLMAAARQLPGDSSIRIVHLGEALDTALGDEARRTMDLCPNYRWLGAVPHDKARQWMARSRALVHMSRLEGGANVVVEAVRTGLPVLASLIDGNVGLLGRDHEGYFEPGNARALSLLMQRFKNDAAFAARLSAQCARLEPGFSLAVESQAVRALLSDMLNPVVASASDTP